MAGALNQMIAMFGRKEGDQSAGFGSGFQAGIAGMNDIQMQPLRKKEAEMRLAALEQQNQASSDEYKIRDLATDAIKIKPLLEAGDMSRSNVMIAERIQKILQRGGDPSDTIAFRDAINSGQITPQQAAAELDAEIMAAERAGILNRSNIPASQRQFNSLLDIVRPAMDANGQIDPTKLTAEQRAAANELGLTAKIGTYTAAERTATTPGMTDVVADSESTIEGAKSGAKEAAKLGVQAKMSPDIERAVTLAKETAKQQADQVGQEKTNAKAMKIYDSAINNLFDALGSTTTGVWAGWAPALTDNARAAEGAIAVMAPVLKEMFRVSGEGTFTKDDQDRLMAMLPSRSDSPPVRAAKLDAIDLVVRAKLSQGESKQTFKEKMTGETDPPKDGGQLMIDANGNRAMVYPDGSFEEIP